MKTVGIIAEYNPLHRGHEYQLDYVRKNLGADFVVIAMSGDFVQRGMPALFPKHVRAEMALRCGADLVLELPVSVSTASAEFFARGGVQLLDRLGVVDELCFGSEEGDAGVLLALASLFVREPPSYQQLLRAGLSEGLSYPAARSRASVRLAGTETLPLSPEAVQRALVSPNNILGIEYCKALLREKSAVRPATLKRQGNGYHDTSLKENRLPSASAIRAQMFSGSCPASREALKELIPAQAADVFFRAVRENGFLSPEALDSLLRYCLLLETPESLCRYLDMSESLAQRIFHLQNEFQGFSQFAALLKTKEITQTRIQRALLHMLLHIGEAPGELSYARVLGFRKSSAPLLGEIKKRGRIPLLTKPADAPAVLDSKGLSVFHETTFASNLYQSLLSQKTGQKFVHEYCRPLVIL